MSNLVPLQRNVAAVAGIVRKGWKPLAGFEALLKVVSLTFFAPISAWALVAILAWSGNQAVSNYDLVSFFLSVKGLILITFTLTLSFAVFFFEIGGLVMISLAVIEGARLSTYRVARMLGAALPRFARLGLRLFLFLAGITLPFALIVLVAMKVFLGESDINYYLQVKPPEFWWAAGISTAAALGLALVVVFTLVRWAFAAPILLLGGHSPREALRESGRLARGRFRSIALSLAAWGAAVLVLCVAAGALRLVVESILLGLSGDKVSLALAATGIVLALDLTLVIVISFFTVGSLGVLLARLFLEAGGDPALRREILADSPRQERVRWVASALWGLVLSLLIVAVVIVYQIVDATSFDHSVAVTAHRGSSLKAPENTISAIRLAIQDGADYCEIDVQETADGVIVLIHDKDLKRVTGHAGNIWETSYGDLVEMDVGSWFSDEFTGVRIATLEEVIDVSKGKMKLNIELKFNGHDKRLAQEVVRIVGEKGFQEDCVLTSLDYQGVLDAGREAPWVVTGLIVTKNVGDVSKLDVDFLSVSAGAVSRGFIDRAHRAGKEVHVWTVNQPDQMNTMIHMGVDNVITDVPDVLVDLQRERAEMSNAEKAMLVVGDLLEGRL
ncbi:MAG: glycerophosphodiester phosphodiesterase family protein [Verrucomicrobiales bacterium]